MIVAAINGVRTANPNRYNINFTDNQKKSKQSIPTQKHTSNNSAKVTSFLLLAMTPAMLYGGNNIAIPLEEGQLKEILAQIPEQESVPTAEFQQDIPQKYPLGVAFFSEKKIQRVVPAIGNGVKANIVFAKPKHAGEPNEVRNVYYVKQSYHDNNMWHEPPRVDGLVYHNIGEDEAFLGIIITERMYEQGEREPYKVIIREVRLDENSAQLLLNFYIGDTSLKNNTFLNFRETFDKELMPPQL